MSINIYYTKKFNTHKDLADFLNFSGQNPIEYGTGYVTSASNLVAVTQNVYSDWQDIDGEGDDLAGYVVLSGAAHGDIFRAIGTPSASGTVPVSGHNQQGSAESPVNYRIYSDIPTFGGTIESITQDPDGIVLTWYESGKLHF